MSTTRKALRQEIGARLDEPGASTATGGSTTTLLDTSQTETGADTFVRNWLWIPSRGSITDVEREITDYTTGVFTFAAYSTMTVISGTEYELWSKFRPSRVNTAINAALRDAWPSWFTENVTDSLILQTDRLEYTLPTMRRLLGVSMEYCGEYVTGTATGGSTSTLEHSTQSWTTNEYAGWHVAIYDGTGRGQYALVASNTATALSLTTTGYSWTVAPDSTSEYIIKNVDERNADYRTITAYRTDKVNNPTKLYLTTTYTDGMYLRLHYLTEPEELDADTDTTDVPAEWIVRQAMAHLCLTQIVAGDATMTRLWSDMAGMHQGHADVFKATHRMPWPQHPVRTEYETAEIGTPADYPF